MSTYLLYGKHLTEWVDSKGKWHEPEATFRALDYRGVRVNRLADAGEYATKEDAEEAMQKAKPRIEKGEVAIEIRIAK